MGARVSNVRITDSIDNLGDDEFIVVSDKPGTALSAGGGSSPPFLEADITGLVGDLAGKQPIDPDLTTIGNLDSSTAGAIASDGAGWVKKTYAQFKTALALVKADVGLGSVDNTPDTSKPLTGDVGGTLGATVIGAAKVTLAMQVSAAANSIRGNNTGAPATPIDLTITQVKTLLAIAQADVSGLVAALALLAPLASPTFTGTPVFPAAVVTKANIVNAAANSFMGNNTGSPAAFIDMTVAQAKTLLAIAQADVSGLVAALALLAPLASPNFTGAATGHSIRVNTVTAGSGIGYATGAGGTVTQLTSRVTGVSLATLTGAITLFSTTLAADTDVSFVLTNALIAATDIIVFQVQSGAAIKGGYSVSAICAAGSATITVHNLTPTITATEAPVIAFAVIKAVTA